MNPAPVVTIWETNTQHLLLVEDATLEQAQAEQRALDFYYYDDGFVIPNTSELAKDYWLGNKIHSGWIVRVNH